MWGQVAHGPATWSPKHWNSPCRSQLSTFSDFLWQVSSVLKLSASLWQVNFGPHTTWIQLDLVIPWDSSNFWERFKGKVKPCDLQSWEETTFSSLFTQFHTLNATLSLEYSHILSMTSTWAPWAETNFQYPKLLHAAALRLPLAF